MTVRDINQLAGQIQTTVDNTTFLSGAPLIQIVDNARIRAEVFTGVTIGSTAIPERYQPAILDLSRSEIMQYLSLQGGDFSDISIGPFSMKKGSSSNTTEAGAAFERMGMTKLKELGRNINFTRVTGGN